MSVETVAIALMVALLVVLWFRRRKQAKRSPSTLTVPRGTVFVTADGREFTLDGPAVFNPGETDCKASLVDGGHVTMYRNTGEA